MEIEPEIKIVVEEEYKSIPCCCSSTLIGSTFLVLGPRDFDSCVTERAKNMSQSGFIVCDPTEKETSLFPDNILSIVLGSRADKSSSKIPSIFSIHKCAGTSSLSEETLEACVKMATKRKLEIDNILNNVV